MQVLPRWLPWIKSVCFLFLLLFDIFDTHRMFKCVDSQNIASSYHSDNLDLPSASQLDAEHMAASLEVGDLSFRMFPRMLVSCVFDKQCANDPALFSQDTITHTQPPLSNMVVMLSCCSLFVSVARPVMSERAPDKAWNSEATLRLMFHKHTFAAFFFLDDCKILTHQSLGEFSPACFCDHFLAHS